MEIILFYTCVPMIIRCLGGWYGHRCTNCHYVGHFWEFAPLTGGKIESGDHVILQIFTN